MKICKRHNKPKNRVWDERQAGGGSLNRIGCVDCELEAKNKPPRPRPQMRPVMPASFFRRPFM